MVDVYLSVCDAVKVERDAEGVPIRPMHVTESDALGYRARWKVGFRQNGRSISFGRYNSRAEAARAADRAAIVVHGDLAELNMPGDISDQEKAELQSISDVTAYALKCRELSAQDQNS
jgi:hypothetical protein